MTDGAPAPIAPELAADIARDPWTRAIGIEYLTIARGYCKASLTLAPGMVNFQGRPHGGVIFTLADATFGAACNSHGVPAVALNVTISYIGGAEPGSRLVAEAREVRQGRRAGFYDVTVRDVDSDRVIAFAHCVAHRVSAD
ncbi:MAG: hotdog fold thioesterase [Candidatus Rokubacteria bacterium]|nr:hotdog fold thioesterase [Candidatus Rokubacteria bacterium]